MTTGLDAPAAPDELGAAIPLPVLVERVARDDPERMFVRDVGGASLAYGAAHDGGLRWAAAFRGLGVEPGDRVVTMLYPSIEGVLCWLGLSWLGAIDTAVNTDYRGSMLEHALRTAAPKAVVVDASLADRVDEAVAGLDPSIRVVVVGKGQGEAASSLPAGTMSVEELLDGVEGEAPGYRPAPWDMSCIIYTSGTTGPSKATLIPWGQIHATATGCFPAEELGPDDSFYSPFAMYHMSGRMPVYVVALCGGSLVLRSRISLSAFWDDIRAHGCTLSVIAGALVDVLMAAEPSDADASLPLRRAIIGPVPANVGEFAERFDVRLGTAFNMTETSVPLRSGWTIDDPRSCGRVREGYPGYEVRVVDEHDIDVAPGELGELIVRTAMPWTLNAGYFGQPEATATAWRNGWFHTGDAFTRDESGNYFYRDRFKDAIRRRGENISSFEVEACVLQHAGVAECAAVAVPDDWSGQEVKAVVVCKPGATVAPGELLAFLEPRTPRFMLPRYVELVDELPKTEATLKVRKVELRRDPLNSRTWDREAGDYVKAG